MLRNFVGAVGFVALGCAPRPRAVSAVSAAADSKAPAFVVAGELLPVIDESVSPLQHREEAASTYLVARLRASVREDGVVQRSAERFPPGPVESKRLPPRLGGGYLFHQSSGKGTRFWRADSWTGPLRPVGTVPRSAQEVVVGFDRIYLRGRYNQLVAIDVDAGRLTTLGPLPLSSAYGPMAFVDGWRAVVETDFAGPFATFDAGETWRPISGVGPLRAVLSSNDAALLVTDEDRFRLLSSGALERVAPTAAIDDDEDAISHDGGAPTFGGNALRLAIERGVPDSDSTALLADEGKLARVALPSGRILALDSNGPRGRGATCHGLRLGDGIGFVCGVEGGATTIHRFEKTFGVTEVRRFEEPRYVAPSGNGKLVVRGACGADSSPPRVPVSFVSEASRATSEAARGKSAEAASKAPSTRRKYCVLDGKGGEREVDVRGEVGVERVVALRGDGIAIVIPPRLGSEGVLNLVKGSSHVARKIAVSGEPSAEAKVATSGLWLDGMWQNDDDSLGGWVEAGGRVLAVTLGLDGKVTPGELQSGVALAMFSGPLALVASGEMGLESTNGGKSWTRFALPPSSDPVESRTRGCTAVGCSLEGWLRVGWLGGDVVDSIRPAPEVPTIKGPLEVAPSLRLLCKEAEAPLEAGATKVAGRGSRVPPRTPPAAASKATDPRRPGRAVERGKSPQRRPPQARKKPGAPRSAGDSGAGSAAASSPSPGWTEFLGRPPPPLAVGEAGFGKGTLTPLGDRAYGYVWGPQSGSWSKSGAWQFRFEDRFDPKETLRSTSRGRAPFADYDGALDALGARPRGTHGQWHAVHDPGGRATLFSVCLAQAGKCELYSAVAEQPLSVLTPPGGLRRPRERGAALVGNRWFFLVDVAGGGTVELWSADSSETKLLAVYRRVSGVRQTKLDPPVLARRTKGAGLAVVLPELTDEVATPVAIGYVVHPVDLETGRLEEPERIRLDALVAAPRACEDDEEGWLVSLAIKTATAVDFVGTSSYLDEFEQRLRLDPTRSCLESVVARSARGFHSRSDANVEPPSGGTPIPLVVRSATDRERRVFECYPR